MCRKCSDDWFDRKYWVYQVEKRRGEKFFEYWLWNETPYPVALPTWDQIAKAL